MAKRKHSRFWTIGLPILMLPVLVIGFMLTGAGHGNYALITCVTFPLGLLVWLVIMKTAAPVAVWVAGVTIATVLQWAYFGYLIDKKRAQSVPTSVDDSPDSK